MFEVTHKPEQSDSKGIALGSQRDSSSLVTVDTSTKGPEANGVVVGEVLFPGEALPSQCLPDYHACHVRIFPTKGRIVDVLA